MCRRFREHLLKTDNEIIPHQKLYSVMNSVGRHNFMIVFLRHDVSNICLEEVKFIKMLNPSLNTAHIRSRKRKRSRPVKAIRDRYRGRSGNVNQQSFRKTSIMIYNIEIQKKW